MKKTFKLEDDLKHEYINDWIEASIRPNRYATVQATVAKIKANKARYAKVAEKFEGMPWFFIGIIHSLEAGLRFDKHLHNGDPLTARTVQEPPNRPVKGKPPFSWEESAVDALRLKGLHNVKEWPVERILFELERYNGFGYRLYHPGVKSPYLWSFTDKYTKGKYVADRKWSDTAVSQQVGGAALLKLLIDVDDEVDADTEDNKPTKQNNTGLKLSVGTAITALGASIVQFITNPYALVFMLAVLGVAGFLGYKYLKKRKHVNISIEGSE